MVHLLYFQDYAHILTSLMHLAAIWKGNIKAKWQSEAVQHYILIALSCCYYICTHIQISQGTQFSKNVYAIETHIHGEKLALRKKSKSIGSISALRALLAIASFRITWYVAVQATSANQVNCAPAVHTEQQPHNCSVPDHLS